MKFQGNRVLRGTLHTAGVSLTIMCSCAAGTAAAGTVGVPTAGGQSATTTLTIPAAKQAAATAAWTRAAISAAPALPMPIDYGSSAPDGSAMDEESALLPAESTPAGAAKPGAASVARAAYAADWAALGDAAGLAPDQAADLPAGTAGVYTSYDVNTQSALHKIYPHIWDGKLTFSVPGGGASCSATAISGNNFVTAAHCVYDTVGNKWYSNWVFTPAYRNGNTPYGTFAANKCTILTAWINLSGSYSITTWTKYDLAVCSVNKNSAGQFLNTAVGFAGRLWNAGTSQLMFNSGYPAQDYNLAGIPSPAQYLRSCTAESFLKTTDTLGMGCNWGPGISGGSWLVGYKPFVGSGWVNSVNSGLYVGQQNIYGIRFYSSNIVPICTAQGC